MGNGQFQLLYKDRDVAWLGGCMGTRGANGGKTKTEKAKGEEPQGSEDSALRFLRMGVWGAAVLRPYAEDTPDGLLGADEVAAAILLPAGFVALVAEGLFFAEADGADAIGGEAQGDEILLDGAGAAIAEREVVLGGTALVAVAFDGDAELRVIAQEVSGLGECCAGVRANVCFVEIKIGVLDFLWEERIQVRRGRGFYRRRGHADRNTRGGVCGTAGTARGDRVCCGIGWCHFCGTVGG